MMKYDGKCSKNMKLFKSDENYIQFKKKNCSYLAVNYDGQIYLMQQEMIVTKYDGVHIKNMKSFESEQIPFNKKNVITLLLQTIVN